jgi:6-phosphogluconolactonase/glucosamine-6-phosphate isomerase/deaminase
VAVLLGLAAQLAEKPLASTEVWLVATGAKKAEAVARMLGGMVDPRCPGSLLQLHPAAEVFLDTAAAERLAYMLQGMREGA